MKHSLVFTCNFYSDFFYFRLFLSLILILISLRTNAQIEFKQYGECTTPKPTTEEYQRFANQIQERLDQNQTVLGGGSYEIPIHLFIRRGDNGENQFNASNEFIEKAFYSSLEFVNQYFHENISFSVCQIDYLDDSAVLFTGSPTSCYNYINSNYPGQIDLNSLNIYLGRGNSAFGGFPHGVTIPAVNISSPWLLHEIGHVFGLYHTFNDTGGSPNCIRFFPDHTPNLSCDPSVPFPPCEDPEPGFCYADLIPDTPIDVRDFCDSDHSYSNYPCPIEIDGMEEIYHPDYGNAMSVWYGTRLFFTSQQQERIYAVLTDPEFGVPPFGGDMSIWIDDDEPVCDPLEYPSPAHPGVGQVLRVNYDASEEEFSFLPLRAGGLSKLLGVDEISILGLVQDNISTNGYFNWSALHYDEDAYNYVSADFYEFDFRLDDEDPYQRRDYDVNVSDLRRVALHILNIRELEKPYNLIAADMNYSGNISTLDMIKIQQIILGIETDFSVPTWRFFPKHATRTEFDFVEDFHNDPFSAIWNHNGNLHPYLPNEDAAQYSYLGGKTLSNIPPWLSDVHNRWHFRIHKDDPHVSDVDTWTFYAIKSGDVSDVGDGLVNGPEDEIATEVTLNLNPSVLAINEILGTEVVQCVEEDDIYNISFYYDGETPINLGGFQFEYAFKGFDLSAVSGGEGIS